MTTGRPFDPRHLDVAAFARAGALLQGAWPQAGMSRLLHDALPAAAAPAEPVDWSAQGECRPVAGGDDLILLHLQVQTAVQMSCQRCLQPVSVPLRVKTTLRFVRDEALAEKLDEESEEDVLVLSAALDLHALIEDELILNLPIVPRHTQCPEPLPMSAGEDEVRPAEAEQPFAKLASMLRDSRGGGKPS